MPDDLRRLGSVDRLAFQALKSILASLEKDDEFEDLLEDLLVQTNPRAADLLEMDDDDAAMDEFYGLLDKYRDKVLRRTGQALVDLYRPKPPTIKAPAHPVTRAYTAWLEEQSTQT